MLYIIFGNNIDIEMKVTFFFFLRYSDALYYYPGLRPPLLKKKGSLCGSAASGGMVCALLQHVSISRRQVLIMSRRDNLTITPYKAAGRSVGS